MLLTCTYISHFRRQNIMGHFGLGRFANGQTNQREYTKLCGKSFNTLIQAIKKIIALQQKYMLTFQMHEATTSKSLSITVHTTVHIKKSVMFIRKRLGFSKYKNYSFSINTAFKHYCCIRIVLSGNELYAIAPFHYRKSRCHITHHMYCESKKQSTKFLSKTSSKSN